MRSVFMFFYGIMALGLFFSANAEADSGCYHEKRLIGTQARHVFSSASYLLREEITESSSSAAFVVEWEGDVCRVPHYEPSSGKRIGLIDCSALHCLNPSDCDAGNRVDDSASLAAVQYTDEFAQIIKKDFGEVWLKWRVKPDDLFKKQNHLWNHGEPGLIYAGEEQAPLYASLGGEPIQWDEQSHAYQVIHAIEYQGYTYLVLKRFVLFVDDESGFGWGPLNIGPSDGVFYLKHRDPDGNLIAVISMYSCGC